MRLDVALVDAGRPELALDHDVGLLEALGDVALLEVEVDGDVGRLVSLLAHRVGAHVVVQQRRVVLHRVEHPGDAGQQLVLDLDLRRGLLGDVEVGGGDGRHGVALVEHLPCGQAVGRQVRQVDSPASPMMAILFFQVREIVGGDDGEHARHLQRLAARRST